jgi:glutathione S-transferase
MDSYGRARVRLWIKRLDEDVHDGCAAILSFGIAFRHQYIERGELGKKMLEGIPNVFKRERRRDVVENGTRSKHFLIAVERMVLLLDEMEEALTQQQWLAGDDYTLADVAFTPTSCASITSTFSACSAGDIESQTGIVAAGRGRASTMPSSNGRMPITSL